jgi:hypothetical protein
MPLDVCRVRGGPYLEAGRQQRSIFIFIRDNADLCLVQCSSSELTMAGADVGAGRMGRVALAANGVAAAYSARLVLICCFLF